MSLREVIAEKSAGAFSWIRRMGVHEAYHRHRGNRWVHWLCIPFELWSVTKLLSAVALGPTDLAVVVIVGLAPVYIATEPLLGALMVVFLVGCRTTALAFMPQATLAACILAALLFAVTFAIQVAYGHGVLEGGRDDTEHNLAELRRTKNPIPIVLVFYYHLVEIAFHLGYRPQLRRRVEQYMDAELAELARTGLQIHQRGAPAQGARVAVG